MSKSAPEWAAGDRRWEPLGSKLWLIIKDIEPCPPEAIDYAAKRSLKWSSGCITQVLAWLSINNWVDYSNDSLLWFTREKSEVKYLVRKPEIDNRKFTNPTRKKSKCSFCKGLGHNISTCKRKKAECLAKGNEDS